MKMELFLADKVRAGVVRCRMGWIDGEQRREDGRLREGVGGRVVKTEGGIEAGRVEGVKFETRTAPDAYRMVDLLEMENLRLTGLVADLLLKNQQLRESN